ncbi:glycoside hydrolase family 28 protein [Thermoflavifilum thermophilum]|uniref:DNA sulfur modification protein DndE n=1 Tax=Thermoflavifilum thermophilum TaxID=1393122 RepID=A0A1I7NL56_9BACT|nr:glycoside hydrolase family 28 protein [Thermoflavifilum thermophilum]SFV35373.1 DNA sulfur modification protein DndE [Thermoflavifilum thermophilum]
MKHHLLLACLVSIYAVGYTQPNVHERTLADYVHAAPFPFTLWEKPDIPDRIFNIVQFGAKPDGQTLNTKFIQQAIDTCAAAGGGVVVIPPGLWLTGPIELRSHIELHLDRGAILLFTPDHSQYPIIQPPRSSSFVVASPIAGFDLEDVAITGEGIIDGSGDSWRPVKKEKLTAAQWKALLQKGGVLSDNGKIWWPSAEARDGEQYLKQLKQSGKKPTAADFLPARDYLRPYMVWLVRCKNVWIEGVTLKNSPKFALYPNYCEQVMIKDVKVNNEWWAQNGDGIDISGGKNVIIYRCTVNAGDDGICMKSSPSRYADSSAALQNVLIADCIVYHGHGGFVIGSNTDGGIKNIYVTNCDFINTDIGIRVKSRRGSGGWVRDIYIDRIYMHNIANEAVLFDTYYEQSSAADTAAQPVTPETPHFTDFHLSDIQVNGAASAVVIRGLPEMPVERIFFTDMHMQTNQGVQLAYAKNIAFRNVEMKPANMPLVKLWNADEIDLTGLTFSSQASAQLIISGPASRHIRIPARLPEGAVVLDQHKSEQVLIRE